MPKSGILHDYDLHANHEKSAANHICVTCGASPTTFQWSDYSGEGMCTRCGTPYQLKWGSDKQKEEDAYPYLNIKDEWVPIVREYYEETGQFVCLGNMMGPRPGMAEFYDWVKERHPSMVEDDS
jgi:hypothetical protein